MTDYEIITDYNQWTVDQMVNEKLAEGFVLVRGVSMTTSGIGNIWYAQAVARVK